MSQISRLTPARVLEIITHVFGFISLIVAAALFIGLIKTYPWAFTEVLPRVEMAVWPWAILTVLAVCGLAFTLARSIGYSLGTLVLSALVVTCVVFWWRWPDRLVSLLGWDVMTGTAVLISLALTVVWVGVQAHERWNYLNGVNAAHELRAEAERKLAAAQANIADQANAIASLKEKRDELAREVKRAEAKRVVEKQEAVSQQERLTTLRLYEAQYVGGFLVGVGFRVARAKTVRPMSINYLQGGRDSELADLVSATAGRFWLIEFKRSEAELKDEFTKHTRERQVAELMKNPTLMAVADRCHFIGWGVQSGRTPKLSISRYLDLWRDRKLVWSLLKDAERFLEEAIPDTGKVATVGVSASEFQQYLRMLEYWGGAGTGDADFAALVMHQDERGNLRFVSDRSFGMFMEGVKQARQIIEERNRWGIDPEPEAPSQSHGPSH